MYALDPTHQLSCLWVDEDGKLLVNDGSLSGPLPAGAKPILVSSLQCDEDGNLLLSTD